MIAPKPQVRHLGVVLAFLGGLTVGALLTAAPIRSRVAMGGGFWPVLRDVVGIGSLSLYVAVLAFPLFLWIARRWPLSGSHGGRRLAANLLVVILALVVPGAVAHWLRVGPPLFDEGLGAALAIRIATDAVPLLGVAAVAHAAEFARRYRLAEVEGARLRAETAEARLGRLTDQLQPHFLFNSLQAISTLLHRDPVRADAVLGHLSQVLRGALDRADQPLVTLADELALLAPYLDLVCARFGDRVVFETDVSDTLLSTPVPPLMLQPLVENAVEHGVERSPQSVTIRIEARLESHRVRVSVIDTGPGPSGQRQGIGLRNTRHRLTQLFGTDAAVTLESTQNGGTEARILLPLPGGTIP